MTQREGQSPGRARGHLHAAPGGANHERRGSIEVRQAFTQDGAVAEMIAMGYWLQTGIGQMSKQAENNGSQFVIVREGVFTNLGNREN